MLETEVIDRLTERLPAGVLRTIQPAADLAALMQANALPQVTPAAFVAHSGARGGQVRSAHGLFVQDVTESVSILIVFRNTSATGDNAITLARPALAALRAAICGWGPDTAPGTFQLLSERTLSFERGTLVMEATFTLFDQLRITP